jgi:hypothetical protein
MTLLPCSDGPIKNDSVAVIRSTSRQEAETEKVHRAGGNKKQPQTPRGSSHVATPAFHFLNDPACVPMTERHGERVIFDRLSCRPKRQVERPTQQVERPTTRHPKLDEASALTSPAVRYTT